MDEFDQIYGTIESVLFSNDENGYSVFKVRDWNSKTIVAFGCVPNAAPGEEIELTGTWTNHPTYGKQFKIEMCERYLPSSKEEIAAYLSSGIIKGLGPVTAIQIVNRFGEDSLSIIINEPERLVEISGISKKKALEFSQIYKEKYQLKMVLDFMCPLGIKPITAMHISYIYKDKAIDVVKDNPYIIAEPNVGGTFSEADRIASQFGIPENNKNRIRAAVFYELRYNLNNGHCFIPKDVLVSSTAKMLSIELEHVEDAVKELIETASIIADEIKGMVACYLPEIYEAETDAAYRLSQRKDNITIITGGPGTGKTTKICQYLDEFDRKGLKYYLIAPTGRAAKRMSEVSGREAATIHRLLEARFSDDGNGVVFKKCETDLLVCDAVILDECSMVDVLIFDSLLKALPDDCTLIIVGDVDQLPPVGPGNVLKALIQSEAFNTLTLTENFRQSEKSKIISNATMINKGLHPDFSENTGDFFRLRREDGMSAVTTICELCSKRLPEKMGIPTSEIQVLSPTKKGELGTKNLNKSLQEVLNPKKEDRFEKMFGETVYRVGDRIMQVRNNYDMVWHNSDYSVISYGIYNGDVGYITDINPQNETFDCDYDGRICTYSFSNFNEIEHAWAVTVHKSQGSEYKAVIMALSNSSKMLLTRDILYTAVTRARNILILVGEDSVAHAMIDNEKKSNRFTYLRYRIKKLCGIS